MSASVIEVLDVAIKVAFPVILGISGWVMTSLRDHDQRIRTLEATSQTKDEAARSLAEVSAVLADIRIMLARIEERLKLDESST